MNIKSLNMLLGLTVGAFALMSISLVGCATRASKAAEANLTEKIKAEPVLGTPEQIAAHAAEIFSTTPGLTNEQRQKLMAIYAQTFSESMSLRKEIGQSKSLLFETIAKVDYKSVEVTRLKKRIADLDKKRLAMMFKSLDQAQDIVGHGIPREDVFRHLDEFEIYHGRADNNL